MKTKLITIISAIALLPIAGFTQAPSNPPNPPGSPPPPNPPEHREKKVPVTFLGVETSDVPRVVSEQLGLAKGFGLVVDYVVPDGPAATAGVQQNDILKMLNDQILTEPDQLSKLVRSYSEGTTITLTILRKGKEEKVTVKLGKKEVPERNEFGRGRHRHGDFPFGDFGMNGDFREQMENFKEQIGNMNGGIIHDAVMQAQAAAQRVRDEAQRRRDEAQRIRDEAQRARDEARRIGERAREETRRVAGQIKITRSDDDGGLKTTNIDIGRAQIVYSDDKGELRLEKINGKKVLTAKDPQGLLLFSGPVETQEELDKVPAAVRDRYEKLQQHDLPAAMSSNRSDEDDDSADTNDNDEDEAQSADQVSAPSFLRSAQLSI